MARLPTPGGDDGTWGQVLNTFLAVEHNGDGTLKNVARPSDVAAKYTKPTGGIPQTDLSSAVQTTLSGVGNATKIQGVGVASGAPSDGEVLQYNAGSSAWVPATVTAGGSVSDATASTKGIVQLGGDLAGTGSSAAAPRVSGVNGVAVSGTPSSGQVLAASSGTAAAWTSLAESNISGLTTDLGNKADDSAVVHTTGAETVAGVKTFSSSPVVPTPTNATDAANKSYVDTAVSGAGGGSGGPGYTFPATKTANYTASNGEFVAVDASGAGSVIQITLPSPTVNGFVTIKKVDTTNNAIEAVAPAGASIDGGPSSVISINNPWQSQDYLSDGTKWYQV